MVRTLRAKTRTRATDREMKPDGLLASFALGLRTTATMRRHYDVDRGSSDPGSPTVPAHHARALPLSVDPPFRVLRYHFGVRSLPARLVEGSGAHFAWRTLSMFKPLSATANRAVRKHEIAHLADVHRRRTSNPPRTLDTSTPDSAKYARTGNPKRLQQLYSACRALLPSAWATRPPRPSRAGERARRASGLVRFTHPVAVQCANWK